MGYPLIHLAINICAFLSAAAQKSGRFPIELNKITLNFFTSWIQAMSPFRTLFGSFLHNLSLSTNLNFELAARNFSQACRVLLRSLALSRRFLRTVKLTHYNFLSRNIVRPQLVSQTIFQSSYCQLHGHKLLMMRYS